MTTITVMICGDHWLNPEQVRQELAVSDPKKTVLIDLQSEGPCVYAIGLIEILQQHCLDTNRDPATILLSRYSNNIATYPYQVLEPMRLSHFFGMSKRYYHDVIDADSGARLFGYFLGRRTMSRCRIMYDVYRDFPNHFVLSCMRTDCSLPWRAKPIGVNLEEFDHWVEDPDRFCHWWDHLPVISIDDHAVSEQYDGVSNTNLDILKYYDQFNIELVSESYTLGETFFPTEKTIRPMMGGKPMIIQGPKNYLKHLRELGFHTWHEVWDESYDTLEGPERWQAMYRTISEIVFLGVDLDRAKQIALHNREVLEKLINTDDYTHI